MNRRVHYKMVGPHCSLGYKPQAPEAEIVTSLLVQRNGGRTVHGKKEAACEDVS